MIEAANARPRSKMADPMPFAPHGIQVALWSPTDANLHVQAAALETHVAFLKDAGVHGLFVLGTTGEFLFLTPAERKRLLELVIPRASPIPVIANVSDIRPTVVQDLARFARQTGAAAVALLPPYYFPVPQEDLLEFFLRAAEAAELPVLLYNFPERTGNRIELDTIAQFAKKTPLAGVKQSGAWDYHEPLLRLGRELGFPVLTGTDTRFPEALELGVAGVTSGLANAVPELLTTIYANHPHHPERVEAAAARIREIEALLAPVWFPQSIAALMEARGLPRGVLKPALSSRSEAAYDQTVSRVQTRFREWGLV